MENPFYVQKSYISSCFETYKLCSDPLEYSHVDLDETQRVQVVEKKEFDAYYHLWLMKLHNYFVVDPWDTNTVYWFSEKYHVMKGTVSVSTLVASDIPRVTMTAIFQLRYTHVNPFRPSPHSTIGTLCDEFTFHLTIVAIYGSCRHLGDYMSTV